MCTSGTQERPDATIDELCREYNRRVRHAQHTSARSLRDAPRRLRAQKNDRAPRWRRGDVVILDNLAVHKAPEVRFFIEQHGATLRYLLPYSHDFNPIEPAWALVKKRIRKNAPRTTSSRRIMPSVLCPCGVRQLKCCPGLGILQTAWDRRRSDTLWLSVSPTQTEHCAFQSSV